MTSYLYRILLVTIVLCIVSGQNLAEDFTYTEHKFQQLNEESSQINIIPQRSILNRYVFPNTWDLTEIIVESIEKEQNIPKINNYAEQISFIKEQTAQFLKLSHKADLLVKNLKQLPQMKNDPKLQVSNEELAAIQAQETKLNQLNKKIDEKGIELEILVQQLMIQQENPLFREAALNFEKKALNQKIYLLKHLLSQSNVVSDAQRRKENQKRLNSYFSELNQIFTNQSALINSIDQLLKNRTQQVVLKSQVISLQSQLKALSLTLQDKEQCANQFESIKDKQRHDRQVIKLIEALKQRKEQFSTENQYCEGVVKKIIQRVKRLLKGYEIIFECAQGLNETRAERAKIMKQLEDSQRKLRSLESKKRIQQFKKNFDGNRTAIALKLEELKSFKLDKFYQSPNSIQTAIAHSQTRIKEIEKSLAKIPSRSNQTIATTHANIVQKVNQINILKGEYCRENSIYVESSEIIQKRIVKLQQQEEHNAWIRRVEIEKIEELEEIKKKMKEISDQIVALSI